MTKDQLNAALLALLAGSGPIAKLLATVFNVDNTAIEAILSTATILTPILIVPFLLKILSPKAKIESITELSPQAATAALSQVSSLTKVKIAEATPEVATVVIKDTANGALAAAASSPAHPNIVSETQNEADAKLGTKV